MLAGHRFSGVSDAYIQRSPQFVADACTAILLIPVLKALGIDDKQLDDELGAELVKKNSSVRSDGDAVIKAATRRASSKLQAQNLTPAQALAQSLDAARVDRLVMQRALGLDTDQITPRPCRRPP